MFLGRSWQNFAKILIYARRSGLSRFSQNSATLLFSDSRNSWAAGNLESWNEKSESGESYLAGWYSAIRESQICLVLGILFLPAAIMSKIVFSSFADAQNSITSKPLVRCGCISNRWKAGRVFQLFGIQLWGRIPTKQPQISSFSHRCSLSRIAVFNKLVVMQKVIEPELLIGWSK
jgi:hypothetical protein